MQTSGILFLAGVSLLPGNLHAQGGDLYETGRGAAAVLKTDQGARAAGMGGAFVAVAEGGNAAFWNPAAMAHSKKWAFVGNDYYEYAPGSDQYVGAGGAALTIPFAIRNVSKLFPWYKDPLDVAIGVSGVFYRLDDIEYRPTREQRYTGAIEWWNWGTSLSAASKLPIPWDGGKVYLGATWNLAAQKFGSDDTPSPFTGEMVHTLRGWGISGLMTDAKEKFMLGIDLRNQGGEFTWADQHQDKIPTITAIGASYRPVSLLRPFSYFSRIVLTVEERIESVGGGGTHRRSHHGGFELRLWDYVRLRGGLGMYSFQQDQFRYKENIIQWSFGLGFRIPLILGSAAEVDLAMVGHPYWGSRQLMSLEILR